MDLFFCLAGLVDGGASSKSKRRTFMPLSTGFRTLYVQQSLGARGEFNSITSVSCEKEMSIEGGIHTHDYDCGGLTA